MKLNVLCLPLDFLLFRIFNGIHYGRIGELEQVFVIEVLRQRFRDIVGIERWHRRQRMLLDHFSLTMTEHRVVDACKAVHWAGSARTLNIQDVVFGVDPPYL